MDYMTKEYLEEIMKQVQNNTIILKAIIEEENIDVEQYIQEAQEKMKNEDGTKKRVKWGTRERVEKDWHFRSDYSDCFRSRSCYYGFRRFLWIGKNQSRLW